jgi:hypothetical protein
MLFTWLVAQCSGWLKNSLAQHRPPPIRWWLTGLGLHAAVVWGVWLVYGLIQAARLVPIPHRGSPTRIFEPPAGTGRRPLRFLHLRPDRLDAGRRHLYAWPALRAAGCPPLAGFGAAVTGVAASALAIFLIYTVNVNLVKADIVYKRGQQFDSQANWLSSIELYRRALATRATEDHYMLFLGRGLLEQAKLSPVEGTATLPAALYPGRCA